MPCAVSTTSARSIKSALSQHSATKRCKCTSWMTLSLYHEDGTRKSSFELKGMAVRRHRRARPASLDSTCPVGSPRPAPCAMPSPAAAAAAFLCTRVRVPLTPPSFCAARTQLANRVAAMTEEKREALVVCPVHPEQSGVCGKQCRESWPGDDGKRKRCGRRYGASMEVKRQRLGIQK